MAGPPRPSFVRRADTQQSDNLKKCRNCKCVWYCDKDCQNKHWKEHKKECKVIKKELEKRGGKLDVGTELDVGPLGKLPTREECPICMHVLPLHAGLQTYNSCCGKTLCCSCSFQHDRKSREQAVPSTCAFCRTPVPRSDEAIVARTCKRIERKDPIALLNMGMNYGHGDLGLPVNQAKCIELLRQSAGLGCPVAHYQLGIFHHTGIMGLEEDQEEMRKCWEKAAEAGMVVAWHNVGCIEANNGDHIVALRHWRLSASGGYRRPMVCLIEFFEDGLLHHGDLAETLQAMYRSRAEMRSDARVRYIKHLKMTGRYDEDFDN
jgi:hypothetical protein